MRTHTLLERLNELRTTPSPMRHAAQALTTDPDLVAETVAAAELDSWPDPQADIPNPLDDDATASNAPPSSTDSPPWEDEQGPGPLTTRRCDWTGCTATLVAIDLDRLTGRASGQPSPALRDLADRHVTPTIGGPSDPPPAMCARHIRLEATRHPAFHQTEWEHLVPAERPALIAQRRNDLDNAAMDDSGHAFLQLRDGDEVWSDDIRDDLEGRL